MAGGVTGGSKFARWLMADAAAEACDVSAKTIAREAAEGQIQSQRWRPDRHSPYRTVYHPGDVSRRARERAAEAATAHVVPDGADGPPDAPAGSEGLPDGPGTALETVPGGPPSAADVALTRLAYALAGALRRTEADRPPSAPRPRTLTVEAAALELDYTPRQIRAAVRAGTLPAAFSSRRNWRTWRIWREDLERLRPPAPAVLISYRREA